MGLRSQLRLPRRRAVCRMNAQRRCWRPVNGSGGREPAGTSLIVDSRPVFVLTPFPVPVLGCEARGSGPVWELLGVLHRPQDCHSCSQMGPHLGNGLQTSRHILWWFSCFKILKWRQVIAWSQDSCE